MAMILELDTSLYFLYQKSIYIYVSHNIEPKKPLGYSKDGYFCYLFLSINFY